MYRLHLQWHIENRDPRRPLERRPSWGMNLVFGTNFLQMHHEMVKATDAEPRGHMQHRSLASWYLAKGYPLPEEWNPRSPIINELSYEPDPSVFPPEWEVTADFLHRTTDSPAYPIPSFFTREGGADVEPITGARRLADFRNTNQLGCVLVAYHNLWHNNVGGAMGSPATAIADPIFYWGVHWHVDRIHDEYKLIIAEREIRGMDRTLIRARHLLAMDPREASGTPLAGSEIEEIRRANVLSERLRVSFEHLAHSHEHARRASP
jgi:hypothetical protein